LRIDPSADPRGYGLATRGLRSILSLASRDRTLETRL
jgi:hypothetical protein